MKESITQHEKIIYRNELVTFYFQFFILMTIAIRLVCILGNNVTKVAYKTNWMILGYPTSVTIDNFFPYLVELSEKDDNDEKAMNQAKIDKDNSERASKA